MKVAITGATGFVGSGLVERLCEEGHQVVVLTRSVDKAERRFPERQFPNLEFATFSPETMGEWQGKVVDCDGVVNLAGEPIAEKRWSVDQKNEILDSRVDTTRALVKAINQANGKPKVLVSGSAIGYYGTSETATFDESSSAGDDFLAEVCKQWEAEAQKVSDDIRLVILRIGIVLGDGGALAKMVPAFKAFAGGPIGSGKQWFSWVDKEDLVSLIIKALTDGQMQGTYNATSPAPVRMNQLAETLGSVLGRPSWMPVPGFALELLLGEGAQVVLEGQQVLPKQTEASGFDYQYGDLKESLQRFV